MQFTMQLDVDMGRGPLYTCNAHCHYHSHQTAVRYSNDLYLNQFHYEKVNCEADCHKNHVINGFSVQLRVESISNGKRQHDIYLLESNPKRQANQMRAVSYKKIIDVAKNGQFIVRNAVFPRLMFSRATAGNNTNVRCPNEVFQIVFELFCNIVHDDREETVLVEKWTSESIICRGRSPRHYLKSQNKMVDQDQYTEIIEPPKPSKPTLCKKIIAEKPVNSVTDPVSNRYPTPPNDVHVSSIQSALQVLFTEPQRSFYPQNLNGHIHYSPLATTCQSPTTPVETSFDWAFYTPYPYDSSITEQSFALKPNYFTNRFDDYF
jgi:hypothetical protein